MGKLGKFWRQVTTGLTIQEIWTQFRRDARSGYDFYLAEATRGGAVPAKPKSRGHTAWAVFQAMFMKLSPVRRVLFLFSIVLLVGPFDRFQIDNVVVDFSGFTRIVAGAGLVLLLALELADRVAMKRDLEIARDIQRMLLPAEPPAIPGVDIAFVTKPANTVAGDYYDAFLRPVPDCGPGEWRLFLVVADVAGKGIPAGMLMATLQASLKTLVEEPLPLSELVARLNRSTCARSAGGSRFITAFLAEMDTATRRISYVNAGHNPPVLARAGGVLEHLEAGGLPLGVLPEAGYECGSVELGPGDILYVFTDGMVEAVNEAGVEYGDARLEAEMKRRWQGSAADRLGALIDAVTAFTGPAPQYDDITCLVLSMDAAPGSDAVTAT